MKRCLELAQKGLGTTRPNPSVGAVIVVDKQIIGEGFTKPYGQSHAEVNAIASVSNRKLLEKATMYVSLEPCSHYGKTPPCSLLIIQSKIPRVVIGCLDTNSLVSGRGIQMLQDAGCEVITGILETECREQHKRFFTYHEKKRPYIILKWAQSIDGFIAPKQKEERRPIWISNHISRQLVHQLRAQEHAILVGTHTAIEDNPKLNVRLWAGANPVRVVIDKDLIIPKDSNVYDQSVKTIFLTKLERENKNNLIFETIKFSKASAEEICDALYKYHIQSVLIEGGTRTLQSFIDENLWDKAKVFTGNIELETGVEAPIIAKKVSAIAKIGNDLLQTYRND